MQHAHTPEDEAWTWSVSSRGPASAVRPENPRGPEQAKGAAHGHRCGLGCASRAGGVSAGPGEAGPGPSFVLQPNMKGHLPFKGRVGGWTCKHSWAPAATAAAHTWPLKHLRVLHPARRSTAASCHARTPAPPQSSRMCPQAGSPRGPPPVGAPPGQPRVLGGAGGPERPTPPLNTQEEGGGGSAGPSDTAPTPTITERVRPMCKGCVCAAQGTGRGPVGAEQAYAQGMALDSPGLSRPRAREWLVSSTKVL